MALTLWRSLGQFIRFGRQQFVVVENNIIRRKAVNLLTKHCKPVNYMSASFSRNFSSAEPSPQKET